VTDWMNHPAVHANEDGTYLLRDEDGKLDPDGWFIRPWPDGNGWRATSHDDSFGQSRFLTAADAIGAVLGDPDESQVVGSRRWTTADTGLRLWAEEF
jgi:hypothetical protein